VNGSQPHRLAASGVAPALTRAFWPRGKAERVDARAYRGTIPQRVHRRRLALTRARPERNHPSVRWYAAVPAMLGAGAACAGEFIVAVILVTVILRSMQSERWWPYTGACAAAVVVFTIIVESPRSGAGINPARCAATPRSRAWRRLGGSLGAWRNVTR
jgi:hypothetical protein